MLKQALIFIFLVVLIGCHHSQPPFLKSTRVKQTRLVKPFSSLHVKGNMNVELHTGYKTPQIILQGDPRDLAEVSLTVVQSSLVLSLGTGYPKYGPIAAEVRTKILNDFSYDGNGSITGSKLYSSFFSARIKNKGQTKIGGDLSLRFLDMKGGGYTEIQGVNSPYLKLDINDGSRVKLHGKANLSSLDVSGDSWLNFYWVKSKVLHVHAKDRANIQLAGITEKLVVDLWDKACFDGRYLRAKRAFVKTHDYSLAKISVISRQHTLASDASNIEFYNIPEMRNDFMTYNGSVLDLRDWGVPSMQEYQRFSKK